MHQNTQVGFSKKGWRWAILLLVGGALSPLPDLWVPSPAQAGLFGGDRNSRGRAGGREQGGAVRAGRLVGGNDATIPYVVAPRNTYLLSSQFSIQWNPVPGAKSYDVKLWRWSDAYGSRDWVVWQTTTTETSATYAGDVALNPARYYSIEVVAHTDTKTISSDQDWGCAGAGFSLLFPENAELLTADLAKIQPSSIPTEEEALTLANVYFRYGMLDAAIATLKTPENWESSLDLNLGLGELYSYAGLSILSLQRYQAALNLSPEPLNQAVALEGMGDVHAVQYEFVPARNSFQAASQAYRGANQIDAADAVERRLKDLTALQALSSSDNPEADARFEHTVCQANATL